LLDVVVSIVDARPLLARKRATLQPAQCCARSDLLDCPAKDEKEDQMLRARYLFSIITMLGLIADASSSTSAAPISAVSLSPADALRTIMEGNQRFASGHLVHPNRGDLRRSHVAKGQHPFVAVLSCSDSRVPPEIIFDQGLGDVFVVRVAGNTVDTLGLQTLAYAVENLGTSLILLLGHAAR
jgi:carbonic anhydrase